jgi:hypothetical protein
MIAERERDRIRAALSGIRRPDRASVLLTAAVALPMLVWLALYQPGMMSPDSVGMWQQAVNGGWTDGHPPIYTAALWVASETVGSPWLVTVAQSLLLAASMVAVGRASTRLGVPRNWAVVPVVVLAISPMVGAFAISVWKDVPYAAVFLFAGARTVDLVTARLADRDPTPLLVPLTGWLVLAALLRQNGLVMAVVLLVAVASLLGPGRRRFAAVAGATVVVVLVGAKAVVYPALEVAPSPPNASVANVLHDLAAHVAADDGALSDEQLDVLEQLAPLDEWERAYGSTGCWSQNWQFDEAFDWDRIPELRSELLGAWTSAAVADPATLVRNRMCVAAIVWSPWPLGPAYTVERSVAPNSDGLVGATVWEGGTDAADDVLGAADGGAAPALLWRAPLWMLLAAVAAAVAARRQRRPALLAVVAPLVALVAAVLPFNPSQDARYMFPGLLLAVLLLPVALRRPSDPARRSARAEQRAARIVDASAATDQEDVATDVDRGDDRKGAGFGVR